ncbi:MAG: tRNA (guanosine(46)-N7)-methyltransferase TrmB [Pseudomonadota bacterium]
MPKLRIGLTAPGELAPKSQFFDVDEVWLEIGFGGGEHMVQQARGHPRVGFLGCEPFIDGVAKVLSAIDEFSDKNIRLHDDDAREVMTALTAKSIARAFILFPDPWPKVRHQKRRIIQPGFLDELHRIMAPGGQLRFATDVRSYADEAMVQFAAHPGFEWTAQKASDWTQPPSDHITTRYEDKRLGDIRPVFYDFVRSAIDGCSSEHHS